MTLRHMNIFCSLIESGCNTTKAAEALNMSQPAVSLAVKELEQYYNVILFDRIGKRLKVTEAGLIFHEYASHIISLFNDMELTLKNTAKNGTIRVGASISIGSRLLPDYIKLFNKMYPGVKVKAVIAPSEQLEMKILGSELDFALIEGIVHHADLLAESYMNDQLKVVCSCDSEFYENQIISVDTFMAQPLLLREKKSATRDLFDAITRQEGIVIEPLWESASTTAIINGVINNLGISVLPEKLVDTYIESGDLKCISVENLSFERTFKLIYHKNKLVTPQMKEFMQICKNMSKL